MASHIDILAIYSQYCDIVSRNCLATSKELLSLLTKSMESRQLTRETILFDDIHKLMSRLNLSLDSRQFSLFYDFVFFICREKGQKNITVNRAIMAWRLVLNGRFRLLNQWCEFVQEHHRYNVSEDTWQQLFAFSRCVNEDLEGYDPKGAWPVIIDEFVDHMYRINESRNCGMVESSGCSDMEPQPSISCTFSGLNLHAGSKRCYGSADEQFEGTPENVENPKCSSHLSRYKRLKQQVSAAKLRGCLDSDFSAVDSTSLYTTWAVDEGLSKGFEGYLSIGNCFQLDQKSRVYT